MKKILLFACFSLLLQVRGLAQQNFLDTIWSGGIMRTLRVYVPAIYDGQTPRPLVFNFHGSPQTAVNFENMTKFRSVADTANFILITPNGTVIGAGQGWNNYPSGSDVDDVLFVSDMIDYLKGKYNIDTARVYSAGYSNGGMMGYELACKLSGRIAAVASVAGSMEVGRLQACAPSKSVPILEIHGTNDPLVPYEGGVNSGITLAAVDSVLKFWVGKNQCDAAPDISDIPNSVTNDFSTVKRHVWPNCAAGSSVELLKITGVGAGHTWPGLSTPNTNRDIIADQEIWRFFLKHKLDGTSGTTFEEPSSRFTIFPNPASDLLRIAVPEDMGDFTVRIFDILGKTVLQQKFSAGNSSQANIELEGLRNGIYFIALDINGNRSQVQKFVVSTD
jgi:polyhydroxybutyrate depolymerase